MDNCYIEWLDGASWVRYDFDVDPTSASWGYTLGTSTYDTYGGRVMQVLSCKIDSLTISGTLRQPKGVNAPAETSGYLADSSSPYGAFENRFAVMEEFAEAMRQCIACQGETKVPSRFCYPMLDWEGDVWLMSYGDARYDVETAAVRYTLKFNVENGFESIKAAASDYGLDSIPDGVNWTRNVYNTPVTTWSEVRQALEALLQDAGTSAHPQSLYDYLDEVKEKEQQSQGVAAAGSRQQSKTAEKTSATEQPSQISSLYNSACYRGFARACGIQATGNPTEGAMNWVW